MLNSLAALVMPPAPPPMEVHAPPRAPAAHPFAEMLRQSQGQTPPSARNTAPPRPAPAPAPAPPAESANDVDAAASTTRPAAAAKAKARTVDAKTPEHTARAEPADKDDPLPGDAKAAEHAAETTSSQPDPAIAQWLADLHLPSAKTTAAGGAATTGSLEESGLDSSEMALAPKGGDAGNGGAARRLGAVQSTDVKATADAVDAKALSRQDQLAGAAAATVATPAHLNEPISRRSDAGATAGALAAAAFNPGGTTLAPAAPPLAVHVATAFAAAEFAQVFGAQVSLLAKDGVHRAELHLNPAEMGPVSVQIVMDGTQARVDFGADTAATRHAIEAGLPELASALRDAGLTLSGGGVSQHSAGGQQSDGGSTGSGRTAAADAGSGAEATRSARPRGGVAGGVDLYA